MINFFKIKKINLFLLLILVITVSGCGGDDTSDSTNSEIPFSGVSTERTEQSEEMKVIDDSKYDSLVSATIHEDGWSTPKKLEFNNAAWEESAYLTRDGKKIIFAYHPFTDFISGAGKAHQLMMQNPEDATKKGLDGKLYVSKYPFEEKEVYTMFETDGPEMECCYYESKSGDKYITSNKLSWDLQSGRPVSVYKNGEMLDLKTGIDEVNAHYCEAKDELWFDCPGDVQLCMYKDGNPYLLFEPINIVGTTSSQAFLTDDCNTLYFTSNRQDGKLAVFKSERITDGWTKPELFLSHKYGVSEVSISSDGKRMAFTQVFLKEPGFGSDIWYAEKE